MYCNYCGKEIADDSKSCKYCGKELLLQHSSISPKKKIVFALYTIWIIINVLLLLLGEETIYEKSEGNYYSLVGHTFNANDYFYPFTYTGYQTSHLFNVKYYDWTELLVYCLLLPLIIYVISTIWNSSKKDYINVTIKNLLKAYKEAKENNNKHNFSPIFNNSKSNCKENNENSPNDISAPNIQKKSFRNYNLKEAFEKAIIPSCFISLAGISFAFIGCLVFFLIGLITCTLIIYLYNIIVPKKILSEEDTIEMCKKYLDIETDNINKNLPIKYNMLTLKSTIYNDINNALIFRYDYDSSQGEIDVMSEYRKLLIKTLSRDNFEENKIYIACVYVGANYIARIRCHKKGESYDVVMESEDMKKIMSSWHIFGSEYSWL